MGILDFLRRKDRSRDISLGRIVRAVLLERFPDATITDIARDGLRIEVPGREEMTMFLGNLRKRIRGLKEEEIDQLVRQFIDVMAPLKAQQLQTPSLSQIVPTIKDQLYLDQAGDSMPLVKEHLAADLWIVYAMDLPTHISTIKPEVLDELGISRDSLRELAIENLRNILPPVEHRGDGNWFLLSAGNDYCASLLLFDNVWNQLQASVDGDLVVAVPTRDIVLVTGSRSPDGLAAIREWARKAEQGGAYAISQTLLRRKGGKWVAFS